MWKHKAAAAVLVAATVFSPSNAVAQGVAPFPEIAVSELGSTVDAVSIETHGVVSPEAVRRYLSVHAGDTLEETEIERDYSNLEKLAGLRPRLVIRHSGTNQVTLHWIVASRWVEPANYPFYGLQPLRLPVQGVSYSVVSPLFDKNRSTISASIQLSQRAGLAALYTTPVHVDAAKGRESDLLIDTAGVHGVYRASEPYAINIYSWITELEAAYLIRGTDGTQLEFGVRTQRSTSEDPTYIASSSVYDTYNAPAKNTVLEGGLTHACLSAPTQWYPPYCALQYRFEVSDAIGGLGATNEYQMYVGDVAHYTRIGASTLALHAVGAWTGGVLPTSFLVCSNVFHGYPKPFCGTSAETVQAEYRIADASPGKLKFILFTETGASRVRGGHQVFAPGTYQWHADSGLGVMYRGVRLNLGYGSEGGRLTFEFLGQSF